MKLKDKIAQKYDEGHIVRRIAEDYIFRTKITFILSTIATIIMAVFNAVIGFYYNSVWYGSMAIYFIALMISRIALLIIRLLNEKKPCNDNQAERKKQTVYLIYGIVIVLLVAALTAMLVQMVAANKPIKTGMIIAIANAAYAFAKLGLAIYNLVKAQRINDTLLKVVRNIGIVDSAVSMLALTVTLITTFGEVSQMRPMLISVAVGVALTTIFIGCFMIVKGARYFIKNKT